MGNEITVRARRAPDGLIHYRVVDDYGTDFQVDPEFSSSPLTTSGLIALIDGVRAERGVEPGDQVEIGLTEVHWNFCVEAGETPEEAVNFVWVDSDLYPGLSSHYLSAAERWLDDQLLHRWDEGNECSCGFDSTNVEPDAASHGPACRTAEALERRSGA